MGNTVSEQPLPPSSCGNLESLGYFGTLVTVQSTRRHGPEGRTLDLHRREKV